MGRGKAIRFSSILSLFLFLGGKNVSFTTVSYSSINISGVFCAPAGCFVDTQLIQLSMGKGEAYRVFAWMKSYMHCTRENFQTFRQNLWIVVHLKSLPILFIFNSRLVSARNTNEWNFLFRKSILVQSDSVCMKWIRCCDCERKCSVNYSQYVQIKKIL